MNDKWSDKANVSMEQRAPKRMMIQKSVTSLNQAGELQFNVEHLSDDQMNELKQEQSKQKQKRKRGKLNNEIIPRPAHWSNTNPRRTVTPYSATKSALKRSVSTPTSQLKMVSLWPVVPLSLIRPEATRVWNPAKSRISQTPQSSGIVMTQESPCRNHSKNIYANTGALQRQLQLIRSKQTSILLRLRSNVQTFHSRASTSISFMDVTLVESQSHAKGFVKYWAYIHSKGSHFAFILFKSETANELNLKTGAQLRIHNSVQICGNKQSSFPIYVGTQIAERCPIALSAVPTSLV